MNKSLALILSVLTFLVAGCGTTSHQNDCGPGCRDAVTDAADDAKDIAGRDSGAEIITIPDVSGCVAPTPFQLPDGSCVECVTSDDCPGQTCCDPDNHICEIWDWATGCMMCEKCVCSQCCVDDDCLQFPEATGVCLENGMCEGVMPCGGFCTPDFPVCAVVQGVEQCVQCKIDADCLLISPNCTCTGDPIYVCVTSDGGMCPEGDDFCSLCNTAADCAPDSAGSPLSCSAIDGTGRCYDPAGTCGISSCCARGQKCFDFGVLIGGLQGLEIETSGSGICECSSDNLCLSTKPCTDLSILCTDEVLVAQLGLTFAQTCPDGQLSPGIPAMICAEVADIVAVVPVPPVFLPF